MERTIVTAATCMCCGCLCDDIDLHTEEGRIVRAERACCLGLPHVLIDRAGASPRPTARVQFVTASPGIDAPGTAYRMDWVPVSMRAVVSSPQPTDEEVLGRIRHSLAAA